MIYAYDLYLPLPVKDIYDTLMMLATVNAAKDMYEKGLKEMEDFNKRFGDFYSPIMKDMDWYDKNVTGQARDVINQLYAAGIDPLRSPEGRMLISRFVNNVPVGTVNKLKLSAAAAEKYLEARGKLEAAGMYNPDFEDFMSNGDTLENWDTTLNGMWLRTSPYEFKTLKEITEPWFNNRTPHELTKDEVLSFGPGYKYDPRYKYTGFTNDDLINVAHENTPGWQGSPYAKYYRDIARRLVIARGENPTDEAIERQLQLNVANAQQEYLIKPTSKADEFALQRQKAADDMRIASIRHSGGSGSGSGNGTQKGVTSYQQGLMLAGLYNFSGSVDPGAKGLKIAENFAKLTKPLSPILRNVTYINNFTMNDAESPDIWVGRFDASRKKDTAAGSVSCVPSYDNNKLYTADEIVSNTLYYPGYAQGHKKKHVGGDEMMSPTGRVYTAPMRDGTYSQFVEVTVGNSDKSLTLWYKVQETEPQPMTYSGLFIGAAPWQNQNDVPVAPNGFSTIPALRSIGPWTEVDSKLNKKIGLQGARTYAGQDILFDNIVNYPN